MTTLILSRLDLEKLLAMEEVIEAIEAGFREMAEGFCRQPARVSIDVAEEKGVFAFMPAHMVKLKIAGSKTVSFFPENHRINLPSTLSTYTLYDCESGSLLALMDGVHLTAMRTGAASGLATRCMARPDAESLAIIGAGYQAPFQLEAILCVRPIKTVKVYNRTAEKAGRFARKMSEKHGIEVTVAPEPGLCAKGSSVVVTCTSSRQPLLRGDQLEAGCHINAVGSFRPYMRELDSSAVKRARVVVDSYESASEEAGELIQAISEGAIGPEHIRAELAEVVSGKKPGRTSRDEVTLFKSCGIALEDAATAALAYRKAVELGVGRKVEL